MHRSHLHAPRVYDRQNRCRTVLDSPFLECTLHSQALACSRPATTPTRPEFFTLISPEEHNVRHPAPPLASRRRFHVVLFRRNDLVKRPKIVFVFLWSSLLRIIVTIELPSILIPSRRRHRTEQERCQERTTMFSPCNASHEPPNAFDRSPSRHRPCSCRSTTASCSSVL